jgi:UDPglucose 6-dehydrogenase
MKIVVHGLWHLGCVTAACAARHFTVVGLGSDRGAIANLQLGTAPLHEPGLDQLIQQGQAEGRLSFSTDVVSACRDASVLWVAFDTPVDDNDEADVESVLREVRSVIPAMPAGTLVLVSSQLPVGTCRQLEAEFGPSGYRFACSPENLRLGKAISIFENADRIVVGCRDARSREELAFLLGRFTKEIVWMGTESAEMTKHALNSFLALSITFMNEVARICETTGADAKEVERGLKTESRIGPKAYLSPGGPFAGGTLARDVVTMTRLGQHYGEALDLFPAIKRSNDRHRLWALQRIHRLFVGESRRRIALLGLTYKPGTNTLRRSSAVELARALSARGYEVRACDPSLPALPAELGFIQFKSQPAEALDGTDAAVVCTEWPEFRQLGWRELIPAMRRPCVIDATRFLERMVSGVPGLRYVTVGSRA